MQVKEYNIQGKIYKMQLFSKIETQEQAYLIGYLLGDGGYDKSTYKRQARIFVSSIEKYIIEAFKEQFSPDTPISNKIPVNNTRHIISKIESHRLQFPANFYETFNKFGLMDLKTNRTYHNISKEYMSSFLLGLFDADGCISWGKRKDRNRLWVNYAITHPNLRMLMKLQSFLAEELNVTTTITPKQDQNCYILRTSNRSNVATIINYMYQNPPKVFNFGKHKHAEDFIITYKG